MNKIMNSLRRVKLVFRKSRPVTKVVALCAVVFSIVALLALQSAILASREQTAGLLSQAGKLEQENQDLADKLSIQGTREYVIRVARELLGLVTPDTVIVQPQG